MSKKVESEFQINFLNGYFRHRWFLRPESVKDLLSANLKYDVSSENVVFCICQFDYVKFATELNGKSYSELDDELNEVLAVRTNYTCFCPITETSFSIEDFLKKKVVPLLFDKFSKELEHAKGSMGVDLMYSQADLDLQISKIPGDIEAE